MQLPCLVHPLVSLHTAREELDSFIDISFKVGGHLRDLQISVNPQSIEFLFNEWSNALDDLKVVFIAGFGSSEYLEVNGLRTLLNTLDFLLLLDFLRNWFCDSLCFGFRFLSSLGILSSLRFSVCLLLGFSVCLLLGSGSLGFRILSSLGIA